MASVARAIYKLQVGWQTRIFGLIQFGFSTFGGPDVFGSTPNDETFGGTYDNVSRLLDRATWSRGLTENLQTILAGEATFTIRDPGWTDGGGWHPGLFNPENAASPLHGELESRMHPVRLEAVGPTDVSGIQMGRPRRAGDPEDPVGALAWVYPLFVGWARRLAWSPRGRRGGTLQIEAVDGFYFLKRDKPIIAEMGPTTTGAAIAAVLDATGVFPSELRALDVGDPIPGFAAAGDKDGLQLIEGLLLAERGKFFFSAAGRATYVSRYGRLLPTKPNTFTLADRMIDVEPGVDFDQARTRVTVTRVDAADNDLYTATATSDQELLQRVGLSDLAEIRTPYLISNTQADQLAGWILTQVESPRSPVYGVAIDNREGDLLTQVLARELVDVITATESAGGTSGSYHIDRMEHSLAMGGDDGRHSVSWLLSKRSSIDAAVFGYAVFGHPSPAEAPPGGYIPGSAFVY